MTEVRELKASIIVATIGFFAALAAIAVTGPYRTDFSDSGDYIEAARNLLQVGAYPERGTLPFFRAPLYPMMIALIWSVFPGSIVAVKLVQAILHAITAAIIHRSGIGIFGSQTVALFGGLLAAVNPLMLYSAAAIQTEALHTLLIVTAIYLTVAKVMLPEKNNWYYALAAGVFFGVAALCRPSALGVGVLAAVWIFGNEMRKRRKAFSWLLIVFGMAAAISPWAARNYFRFGDVILVNDAGGYALWVGNHPANLRFYDGSLKSAKDFGEFSDWIGKTLPEEMIARWEQTVGYSNLSPGEREALWRNEAIANFRQYPHESAELFVRKVIGFWKPVPDAGIFGVVSTIAMIFEIPLMLAGLIGLLLAFWRPEMRPVAWFFGICVVVVTAVHVVLVATVRMRVPYIEPWMALFAGVGLTAVLDIIKKGREKKFG